MEVVKVVDHRSVEIPSTADPTSGQSDVFVLDEQPENSNTQDMSPTCQTPVLPPTPGVATPTPSVDTPTPGVATPEQALDALGIEHVNLQQAYSKCQAELVRSTAKNLALENNMMTGNYFT